MKRVVLELPAFAFAVATRAAIGAGVGLLIADRLPRERRRRIAMGLIALGAATTIPVLMALRSGTGEARKSLAP